MYDFDDTVTAVTFRINGLSTQDVLSHIHNTFSDKIARDKMSAFIEYMSAVLVLSRGPVKCPSTPNQPAPMTTAGGGAEDQRIAGFRLGEEADLPLRSRPSRSVHTGFFRPLKRADPAR